MEQYEQEIAFLESMGCKDEGIQNHFIGVLSKYKAYFIEQAKKGKLTSEDFLKPNLIHEGICKNYNQFTDEVTINRRNLITIMQGHANQFIPAAPESTTSTKKCKRCSKVISLEETIDVPGLCQECIIYLDNFN